MGAVNDFGQAVENGMAALMSLLKFHINDYCDLETTSGNALVAKDGSMGTVLRYNGFRSLIGRSDFQQFSNDFSDYMETYLGTRGHQMQVVFSRDEDCSDEVATMLAPCYETARILELDLKDLLDEKQKVTSHFCMAEHVYIVLWTRPSVLDPVEVTMGNAEMAELRKKYKIPTMKNAQNVLRPLRFLIDRHESFVAGVVGELTRLRGSVTEIEIHKAIRDIKRSLYKNTPESWSPSLVGDPINARWKTDAGRDISALMYPRLDDQIFSSPAINGNKGGVGGVTDLKAVRIGGRLFAPMVLKIPPKRVLSFTALFGVLNNAGSTDSAGKAKQIPWAVSFLIEGDGLKGIGIRKLFSGILAWSALDNRNMVAAAQAMKKYQDNEDGCVVKLQITAVTWSDWGEEKQLMLRRSKLAEAIRGWGSADVSEETGDATGALMSCVPGMSLKSVAPESAAPLHDVSFMLPFSRPASPFGRGTTLFRTLDGKVMPYEVFSDQQNTWITCIFGGPGSGKSVLSNRLNEEMCLLAGLTRLPYICVIDIGISSSGFISLIEDALPEKKKHLALYTRIQNTSKYAMNQFDTQLGMRHPLPREREVMKNFLVRLATPPERGRAHVYMNEFVGRVVDEAFKRKSDKSGVPNEFAMNINAHLAEQIRKHGIEYSEATKWWTIVDEFFSRGLYYEASVAQRYAVPDLFTMLMVASDPDITKEFVTAVENDMPVAEEFKLMINAAKGDFPIFNGHTQYDIGEARVMALDLQDVVTTGSAAARKQASLMYMVALSAFMRKVSIIREDLDVIPKKYQAYHSRRIDELAEDYKRLFCDEYHKTGGDENLRESFLIYGRESRKWQLEIVLASQLPTDFKGICDIATTILILDAGNEQTRGTIKEVFGLSETEVMALKTYVHGAQPGVGATFLAKLKTKTADLSQLFTSTSGGLELWGLSTTPEDRTLRTALYKVMPSNEARRVLKARFPGGSCKSYVLDKKMEAKTSSNEAFVDDEVMESVVQQLATELIRNWRVNRADDAVTV